ncbi:MAG: DUF1566 domain-containing protein [Leptospiraceae bacterium]|nr:DUF1566 domain-containing protein [Leptospiraceae bacterium]
MKYRFVIIVIFFIIQCRPEVGPPNHRLFPLIGTESRNSTNNDNPSSTDNPTTTTTSTSDTVSPPVFSIAGGHQTIPQMVTLSTTTTASTIYYTMDGSTPTASSTLYTTSIGHVWALAGRTIKAITIKGGISSTVTTAEYTSPNVKTGQTICYNTGTNIPTACPVERQDGEIQSGLARGYIDNGDETVTDTGTGLIWMRCPRGRSGVSCGTGSNTTDTRANQETYCSTLSLAGKVWRLPTRSELLTLVDFSSNASTIHPIFPNNGSINFWSSTINAQTPANSYNVTFNSAETGQIVSTTNSSVRCVTGLTRKPASYVDNLDGTIKDKVSGLVWQRCPYGTTNDATCSGVGTSVLWNFAVNYCTTLSLAGRTWRLPNALEVESLADLTATISPTVQSIFVNNSSVQFWSSTTYQINNANAFNLNFITGNLFQSTKTNVFRVRCISDP